MFLPRLANPCKDIAAYYLPDGRFDENRFLLFGLRRRRQDEITAVLRELRAVEVGQAEGVSYAPGIVEVVERPGLEERLDRY